MHYFCLDVGGTETRSALFDDSETMFAHAKGVADALLLRAGQVETPPHDRALPTNASVQTRNTCRCWPLLK